MFAGRAFIFVKVTIPLASLMEGKILIAGWASATDHIFQYVNENHQRYNIPPQILDQPIFPGNAHIEPPLR